MKGLNIVCWLFIIGLMAENGSQGREIRKLKTSVSELESSVTVLQQDLQGAYEALNNIQNSATNIIVFPNTYESD